MEEPVCAAKYPGTEANTVKNKSSGATQEILWETVARPPAAVCVRIATLLDVANYGIMNYQKARAGRDRLRHSENPMADAAMKEKRETAACAGAEASRN